MKANKNMQDVASRMEGYVNGTWSNVYPDDILFAVSCIKSLGEIENAYCDLRVGLRNAMGRAGIITSMGWSDQEIIDALKAHLNAEKISK